MKTFSAGELESIFGSFPSETPVMVQFESKEPGAKLVKGIHAVHGFSKDGGGEETSIILIEFSEREGDVKDVYVIPKGDIQ